MGLTHKEWNAEKGAMETWTWNPTTEQFTIKNTFELGSVLEANKRQQSASLDQRYGNEMMHSVAEIPMAMVTVFLKKHNVDVFSQEPEQKLKLRKLLDDPEYRYLKTTTKRLWRPTK
tara:strand:+ start:1082 stop:1432 length:351 start_codon:yes stop_codon:yes gene_type:complete